MAVTSIHDGCSHTLCGHNAGDTADVYRYSDKVTGIVVDGWRVFVDHDQVVVKRVDSQERLCMQYKVPDDPDLTDLVGESIVVTVGQTREQWPSSAMPFILGHREMSWGKVE